MKQIKILLVAFFPLITSCSLLSPVKVTPKNQYILEIPQSNITNKKNSHKTVFVASPDVRPVFNTQAMAYSFNPYQINYYAKNEWAETPGQLMQNVLIQGMTKSHGFKAVVTSPITGHVNYLLNTTILSFNQNFQHKDPYFELIMNAQLIDPNNNQLIRSHLYSYHIPMVYKSPYAGVYAANKAALDAVNDLIEFCR